MKVLMFGWEFPPHITGGLGTACQGITQSLVSEGLDVTFVVPKLIKNDTDDLVRLVSAESAIIPIGKGQSIAHKSRATRSTKTRMTTTLTRKTTIRNYFKKYTTIEVDSDLVPYTESTPSKNAWTVEQWNYVFDSPSLSAGSESAGAELLKKEKKQPVGYRFSFNGGYGTTLMDEVENYARVARELAMTTSHDVIHAHDWMTFPAGEQASKVSKKPLVVHVHATEFDRTGRCEGAIFRIEKAGMKAADHVIAVSNWTKKILIDQYGVPGEKITVVHNGINARLTSLKKEGPPIGSEVVTFLGRITYQKGPKYFVEAARKVAEQFPKAHFIVAGSGDLLPQTIDRVAQLRLSDRFHFTGFVTSEWMARIWSMSDVYVMPSVSEPFGITPLEAVQAGVPVIVSRQSGVAEVMEHALKVDFWNTTELAETICSVLRYKSLSTMLRKEGTAEVGQLTWPKAATNIIKVYEQLT